MYGNHYKIIHSSILCGIIMINDAILVFTQMEDDFFIQKCSLMTYLSYHCNKMNDAVTNHV